MHMQHVTVTHLFMPTLFW